MNRGAPAVLDSGKLRVHWLLRRRPRARLLRVADGGSHLEVVRGSTRGRSVGIYVHVPYCRSICTFCPYFRQVLRDRGELEGYLSSLLKELELYGRALEGLSLEVVEVHVGGGTPSLVPPRFYGDLLAKLSEFFRIRCGVGIEANPEDLRDPEYVGELYSRGVDEVSIGVQSFDRRVLKVLGRKHPPEDGEAAVRNCLGAGFRWVNVDLMFLAPSIRGYVEMGLDEKLRAFRGDLERSVELGAHQVTFYATVVPRSSPGYRLAELGRLQQEVEAVDLFVEEALEFVESSGLHLTRVYSASRRPYEYATVNLEMVGPLIGLGAGAWGNTGYYQYVNVHSIAAYVELLREGRSPAAYARKLDEGSIAWRVLFDQLSSAVVREEVFSSLDLRLPLVARALLKLMELSGLVERVGGGYRLTRRGVIEVYKSVMNYVLELPVRVTEVLAELGKQGRYPQEVVV